MRTSVMGGQVSEGKTPEGGSELGWMWEFWQRDQRPEPSHCAGLDRGEGTEERKDTSRGAFPCSGKTTAPQAPTLSLNASSSAGPPSGACTK